MNTYQRRKADGVCVNCGDMPPRRGRCKCEPCLELRRQENRIQRKLFREANICIHCHQAKPMPERANGLSRCSECHVKARANLWNWRMKQKRKDSGC